jgi:hypothetical protein
MLLFKPEIMIEPLNFLKKPMDNGRLPQTMLIGRLGMILEVMGRRLGITNRPIFMGKSEITRRPKN